MMRFIRVVARDFLAAVAIVVMLSSCDSEPIAVVMPPAPVIDAAVVTPNPNNVLGAVVSIRAHNADSVSLLFRLADPPSGADVPSAAVRTAGDSAAIAVLGLLPERKYAMRVVAYGAGGTVTGGALDLTTGALPPDLPQFTASGSDPSPGFVVFAARMYGVVIDNTGRVVWYRRFPNGPGLSFMAEPNGRYLARPMTADPTDIEPWIELDPLGNPTRTLGCALGLQPRPHDIITLGDGSYWLMCDDSRTMDLTADGGVAIARVTGTSVQHVAADGTLLFRWSPFDHFSITDVVLSERIGASVNWTHGNALDLDTDGNLIVSFRNLDEVTKINTASGAVMWRLGGRRNQFTFIDSPEPAFSHQHSVRVSAAGELMIVDNIGNPNESRAEHYTLDAAAKTARLVRSYGSVAGAVVTQIGGSVQSLPGERTLVSFGTEGRVEEYDALGRVVWRIEGNPGYIFRAQRIRSLYAPGVGTSR
ncbi:MAG TPA: arylsulfotransferase family protein [Gemmatimonadaceae bacterium]|nr:arylsulfotransferase family protein [Gemmatimonadaceae bacterium]